MANDFPPSPIGTANAVATPESGPAKGLNLEDYWRDRLVGGLERPTLPYDLPARATPAFHYARVSREIEARLDTALLQLVRRENAKSVEDVWCAALACVMHRYDPGSCSPIRIGRAGPTTGHRTHCDDAIADLILGFITSTRISEVRIDENSTFRKVLKAMIPSETESTLSAEAVKSLATQNLQSLRPALPVAFGAYRSSRVTAAGCDLAFSLEPGKGLTLQYNTFRFTRGGANRVLGHIFELLADALQKPDEPLGDLQLLTENERESMSGWNITGSNYPGDRCLHELFEAEVEQRPETTALVAGGTDITFANLNRHAEQIAWLLAHNGAGRGTLVAVYGEPGFDFVAALLGVWKTGGICIPIDSRMPEEQVSAILTNSRPALVVCRQTEDFLRHEFLRTIELKSLPPAGSAAPVDAGARPPVTPDEIATIVYPAGSVRGVMGLHRALINRIAWVWRDHPFERGEVAGSRALANSADFLFEVFAPLLAGAPVVFFDSEATREPRGFLEALATSRITRVVSPPVVLEDVVRERETAGEEIPDLRIWTTIGGSLRVHTARRFQALFPGATLLNAFGPAETTSLALSFDTQQLPTESLVVPAGLPAANTKIRVVDANGKDAPIGIPGEVRIGGESLARGYLNDAEATAEAFKSEAVEGGGETRWFKTGMLGKFLPSGEIEMIGRIDEAIEIDGVRGHRGEIERLLRAHPEVDRAAVRVSRTSSGPGQLYAFVTPTLMTRPPRESDLRKFLRERLPRELVPRPISPIPSFPRTLTSEIDWSRMPAPKTSPANAAGTSPASTASAASAAAGGHSSTGHSQQANEDLERQLAALWGELIGGMPASHDVDLFQLGGDHDTILALVLALSRNNRHRIAVSAVLENPTIRKLAAYLASHHDSEDSWNSVVNLRLAAGGAPLFLIHDIGPGSLGVGKRLADALTPGRSVYAQTSRALSGFGEFASVPEMAAQYVRDLRSVYPEGPVFLAGFYFGGRIALEMARQLRANKEDAGASLVVLLDSHPHGGKSLFGRGAAQDPGLPPNLSPVYNLDPCAERFRKLVDGQIVIRDRHADDTYPGKIALLKPQVDPIFADSSPDYGWSKVAGSDVEVISIPCEGDLRRHPETVAAQLGGLLGLSDH